ncbi:MAG: hypothetical protein ABWY39_03000 [Mycobacterium sp.]
MTAPGKGLDDILADYTAAMNGLERQDDPASTPARPRRVLLPADQQRGCESPRLNDRGRRLR